MRLARWASVADASIWGDAILWELLNSAFAARHGCADGRWSRRRGLSSRSACEHLGGGFKRAPEPSLRPQRASGLRWSQAATVALGASDTFEPMMERATEGGAAPRSPRTPTHSRPRSVAYTASTQARLSSAVNEEGRGCCCQIVWARRPALALRTPTTAVTHAGSESGAMAAGAGRRVERLRVWWARSRGRGAASAEPDGCAAMLLEVVPQSGLLRRTRSPSAERLGVRGGQRAGGCLSSSRRGAARSAPASVRRAWVDARVVAGAGRVTSPPWPRRDGVPAFSGGCSCE